MFPKLDEIRLICAATNCAILALAETWLSSDILDSEITLPEYTLFRQDRNRQGGGVAIYAHNSLSATLIPHGNPTIELILIRVSINSHSFVIGSYYRPPNSPESLMALNHTLQSLNPLLL